MAVRKEHVAHGSGSDPTSSGYATKFSNTNDSKMSSLGVYRCNETYSGKHGKSLRLDGLEVTNSKARDRAIVVHAADYVTDTSAGRSWGCPALSNKAYSEIIDRLQGGSLLTIWSKTQSKG